MKKFPLVMILILITTLIARCGDNTTSVVNSTSDTEKNILQTDEDSSDTNTTDDTSKVISNIPDTPIDSQVTKPVIPTIPIEPTEPKIELPLSFTKRVLVEKSTGTWCGYCPDASQRIREVSEEIGEDNIVNISIHSNDEMDIPEGGDLYYALGRSNGTPSVSIDRTVSNYAEDDTLAFANRGYISAKVKTRVLEIPTCGVSIDATGDSVIIYAGFLEAVEGDISLTTYLIEDGLIYDQKNGYDEYYGSDYYGLGNPIVDFEHSYVLKDILSEQVLGDTLQAMENTIERFAFAVNYDEVTKENCSIVAAISIIGSTNQTHEVLNVNHIEVGEKVDWNE